MDSEQSSILEHVNFCGGIFDLFYNGYNEGKKYDQQLMNGWAVVRMTVGNLIVRGYRIFKALRTLNCIIFFKSQGPETEYIYLQVAPYYSSPLPPTFLSGFNSGIAEINMLKQRNTHKYSIVICYALEKTYL